jgi:sarcosine oxidase subunit delta
MDIACPFCGRRDVEEFQFRTLVPDPDAEAFARLYERVNRSDDSLEYWQHVSGCRAWLVIRRNPTTAEIHEVRVLGEAR